MRHLIVIRHPLSTLSIKYTYQFIAMREKRTQQHPLIIYNLCFADLISYASLVAHKENRQATSRIAFNKSCKQIYWKS